MSEEVTRHCPNCKSEIRIVFEGRSQGEDAIKKCPGCDLPVLFCPDGYILQAVTPFASRKQDQPGYLQILEMEQSALGVKRGNKN